MTSHFPRIIWLATVFWYISLMGTADSGPQSEIGTKQNDSLDTTPATRAGPGIQGRTLDTLPTTGAEPGKSRKSAPTLTEYLPKGCLTPGLRLQVLGRALGKQSGKALVLANRGNDVRLTIRSWTDQRIVGRIPSSAKLRAGEKYRFGIKSVRGNDWLNDQPMYVSICPNDRQSLPVGDKPEKKEPSSNGIRLPPVPTDSNLSTPDIRASDASSGDNSSAREIILVTDTIDVATSLESVVQSLGYSIRRQLTLENLGFAISVLGIPLGVSTDDSLVQLRQALPEILIDTNHFYAEAGSRMKPRIYGQGMVGWQPRAGCGLGVRIGMVDTGIDQTHPALRKQHIITRSFLPSKSKRALLNHGTAIAALLVGDKNTTAFTGMMPEAELYAASVFHQRRSGRNSATAERVAQAIDWLAENNVHIINLSLSGPPNLVMELVIKNASQLGIILVAASGNGGPKALPAYPAALKPVIAVTAVDSSHRNYKQANRGSYIDFAAPGVDVWSATEGGGGSYNSGTSFAVPFAIAAIATGLSIETNEQPEQIIAKLRFNVRDLGQSGKDDVFGWGLIRSEKPCGPLSPPGTTATAGND
jgi:hypothetical protein